MPRQMIISGHVELRLVNIMQALITVEGARQPLLNFSRCYRTCKNVLFYAMGSSIKNLKLSGDA